MTNEQTRPKSSWELRAEKAEADLAEARHEMRQRLQQRITTRCPSCGHQSLFIGSGGRLTCSWLECKDPGLELAIEKVKASPPAPSGWQQRIAAMSPWEGEEDSADERCFFCHREKALATHIHGGHAPDCLWDNACDAEDVRLDGQNAKDALPAKVARHDYSQCGCDGPTRLDPKCPIHNAPGAKLAKETR